MHAWRHAGLVIGMEPKSQWGNENLINRIKLKKSTGIKQAQHECCLDKYTQLGRVHIKTSIHNLKDSRVVVGEAVVHEKQSNSGGAEEDAKHGVVARVS